MNIISQYIAPWALTKEHIPIHFLWEPDPTLDTIDVELSDLSVVDVLNVSEYALESDGKRVTIASKALKSDNYFGLVVSYPKKPRRTRIRRPIKVSFLSGDGLLVTRVLQANIVRPKLKLVSAPEKLIVNDSVNPKNLFNLTVAHLGFGMTKVEMEIIAHGNTISKPSSLYMLVLQELIEDLLNPSVEKEAEPAEPGYTLDEKWLQATTKEIARQIRIGNLPPGLKDDAIQQVMKMLEDEKENKRILRAIYLRLRRLLWGAILHYMDRYPAEDIDLPMGKIRTTFRSEIKQMSIVFTYADSMGNRYSPLKVVIDIDDSRENKEKIFDAPINVTWEIEKFEM